LVEWDGRGLGRGKGKQRCIHHNRLISLGYSFLKKGTSETEFCVEILKQKSRNASFGFLIPELEISISF